MAQQLFLPCEVVKKSNALARARWSAESVWEPRLVALLASQVRADDTDFHVYEVPVSAIMREREKRIKGGTSGGKDFKEIEAVVDRVMGRVLTIKDEKGRGWTKYNVFSKCRYRAEDHVLELGFHPDLRPHYLNLKEKFAQWNLLEFLMLPSIYSQRIFEILKSWDDKPDVTITITDLHEMLDIPSSLRRFPDFRRRVLEKAHQDIHKNTNLRFEWEPIKEGKAVTKIKFTFDKKRALYVATKKESEIQAKQSKINNENFKRYLQCFNVHGSSCLGGHQTKEVCDMCKKFR